jgi:class 3 adenylate cyclase
MRAQQRSPIRDVETFCRTVAVVDLVGYSTLARMLEENMGSGAVADLNRQIQTTIQGALKHLPSPRTYNKAAETGDGAILLFESPQDAHCFAEQLHLNAEKLNRSRTEESAMRRFRVGISTGEVTREDENEDGTRQQTRNSRYAGMAISNAVRLETAAEPGETIIDLPTFALLPEGDRRSYGEETAVPGKRAEVFRVRRYRVSPMSVVPPPNQVHHIPPWLMGVGAIAVPLVAAIGIWVGHREHLGQHPPPDGAVLPVLQRVQAKPNSVQKGDTITVTVELDRPAPRGGASVTLSSTDPAILTVDGNALVPEGETVGTNYSRAVAVPTYSSPVQLLATYGDRTRRANVNVVQGPTSRPTPGRPSTVIYGAAILAPPSSKAPQATPSAPALDKGTAAPAKTAPLNPELLSRLEEAQARLAAEDAFWVNVKKTLPPGGSLRPEISSQIFAAQSTSQRCNRNRQDQDATSLASCIDSLNDHLNQLRIQH